MFKGILYKKHICLHQKSDFSDLPLTSIFLMIRQALRPLWEPLEILQMKPSSEDKKNHSALTTSTIQDDGASQTLLYYKS